MKLPPEDIKAARELLRVDATRKRCHGIRLKNARVHYGKPHVCPDCYLPRHLCEHTEEWGFLRHE